MNDAATRWVLERVRPGEDLDRAQLAELATALGRERGLWEDLVRFEPDERYFAELYRDVNLDVWLLCWLNAQDTGFHDHDVSAGGVYVCEGFVEERRLRQHGGTIREEGIVRGPDGAFDFDAAYVHRMRHVGDAPAVSIHCYSPALWRMGHYHFDEEGNLCRTSATYADEMWTERVVGEHDFSP